MTPADITSLVAWLADRTGLSATCLITVEVAPNSDPSVLASCRTNYPYSDADITVSPTLLERPPHYIARTVLHEVCHVMLAPLVPASGSLPRFLEQATSTLEAVIWNLLPPRWWEQATEEPCSKNAPKAGTSSPSPPSVFSAAPTKPRKKPSSASAKSSTSSTKRNRNERRRH